MAQLWVKRGDLQLGSSDAGPDGSGSGGHSAEADATGIRCYARQQSMMWFTMAEHAQEEFQKTNRKLGFAVTPGS